MPCHAIQAHLNEGQWALVSSVEDGSKAAAAGTCYAVALVQRGMAWHGVAVPGRVERYVSVHVILIISL